MKKRYYIVYRTTCLKNGKYYIGCHATDNLNDGYLGSGVDLLRDVARYGRSSFVREILHECSTQEEAALKERELVNAQVVNDPKCYNKHMGGQVCGVKIGVGREAYKERKRREAARRRERYREDPAFRQQMKEKSAKTNRERYRTDPAFRARFIESVRKSYRKRKFKQKLTTSADFRDSFVLRCKSDATLLQKTLELFKRDADFCELLKNLIENQ